MRNYHCWIYQSRFVRGKNYFIVCMRELSFNTVYCHFVLLIGTRQCNTNIMIFSLSLSLSLSYLCRLIRYVSDIPAYMLLLRSANINTLFEPSM